MFFYSLVFVLRVMVRWLRVGMSVLMSVCVMVMCIEVGNMLFDDCEVFMWLLGCIVELRMCVVRVVSILFMFMFEEVLDLVW